MRWRTGVAWFVVAAVGVGLWWAWPTTPTVAPPWQTHAAVLAGNGEAGARDGDAESARFSDPFGVAVDGAGTLYVSDGGHPSRICAVSPMGDVRTLAGGTTGFRDGPGPMARFDTPSGLAVAADGHILVADTGNNAVRTISPLGIVTTLAGDGRPGLRDGPGDLARFNGPVGVAVDASGHIVVADTYNDAIREVHLDGSVHTRAGSGTPGWRDGPAAEAQFDTPTGLVVGADGVLIIADTGNDALRTLDPHGQVQTLRPSGLALVRPIGLAIDAEGTVYVSEEQGRIVALQRDGTWRVLAGGASGFANGVGHAARFRRPAGLAVLGPRRLAVADTGNRLLRRLVDAAVPDDRPPGAPGLAPSFDPEGFARVPLLWPVAPMDGPHEVAGTHGERRGADGAERFHTGVDIRVPQDTPVHAVRAGHVSSPLGNGAVDTLNEWLRVGDVLYVHIRAGRTRTGPVSDTRRFVATHDESGALVRLRVKRGARFDTGDRVGAVNTFNHVHLGIGWPGDDHDPLGLRLVQFVDTIPPTIAAGGLTLTTEAGVPVTTRTRGRVVVSGRVHIVVDAWDQAEGNVPWRRLGVHTLGYQVLHPDGSPAPGFAAPRITQRFDRLGGDPEAPRLVYAAGSGIPAYGSARTRFLYVVTTWLEDGLARADSWDTTDLPPGDYTLRVHVADRAGNVAQTRRDLPVTVHRAPGVEGAAGSAP